MKSSLMIPPKIKKKFSQQILNMYKKGELSASRAAQMLGIPRAAFYNLLAETKIPLPQKLNNSLKRELAEFFK